MSSDVVISASNLSKTYRIYDNPLDRIFQRFVFGAKKYYKDFAALDNISFEIRKGETVGIIGRNGSGKSTLLQMVCGILKPTAGVIHTAGRVSALLELGAGFHPEFTGRENVYMQGAIMGINRKGMDTRFADIEAFAEIGAFIDQPVKTYSSGMFVRLAFSAAIHVDPDLLLIDEALSVGDAAFGQKCMRYFRKFKQNGTLLVVSHDIQSIIGLCDRVIWIANGKIQMQGDTKKVCETYMTSSFGPALSDQSDEKKSYGRKRLEDIERLVDQRQTLFNASNLRNDLEIFRFNPDASSFCSGKARITDVRMINENGAIYSWIVGGELVTLLIKIRAEVALSALIVGFLVKDKLGQTLFGDNTYLTYASSPVAVAQGSIIEAKFKFQMPRLPKADYSICAAIADGSQNLHETHHWMHDALLFRSHNNSVSQGLVGIPILEVDMREVSVFGTDMLDSEKEHS